MEWVVNVSAYELLVGKTAFFAREVIVAVLWDSGDLDGEPKVIICMVNFYEKGDKFLEIVVIR